MKSIFTDKARKPTAADLERAPGKTLPHWEALAEFTRKSSPGTKEEWKFSGEKYGWSYRISDKRRVLIYLLPRDGFFKAAFALGQAATDEVLASDVSDAIKRELKAAKVYAEGRGIRVEVRNRAAVSDVKKLIAAKV